MVTAVTWSGVRGGKDFLMKKIKLQFLTSQTLKDRVREVWEACLRVLGYLGWAWYAPGVPGMRLGCVLEVSWSYLGRFWEGLGRILASLDAAWEPSGDFLKDFLPS